MNKTEQRERRAYVAELRDFGWTQQEIADRFGISRRMVQHILATFRRKQRWGEE
jgi:DNA-binding transcriptional regulator LsrR (DeoR family)